MQAQPYWFLRPYLAFGFLMTIGILIIVMQQSSLRFATCDVDCIAVGADKFWKAVYFWAGTAWVFLGSVLVAMAYERKLQKEHQKKYFSERVSPFRVAAANSNLLSNLVLVSVLMLPVVYMGIRNTYQVTSSGITLPNGSQHVWQDVTRIETRCAETSSTGKTYVYRVSYNISFKDGTQIDLGTLVDVNRSLPLSMEAFKVRAPVYEFDSSAVAADCSNVLNDFIKQRP